MRGSGKSTWVRHTYPTAHYIDLLREEDYLLYMRQPGDFALLLASQPDKAWVIVDEIQRLPHLLNEVHRAIEQKKLRFILTGSSSRKLQRASVNLLGGRASLTTMYPLTPWELGTDFFWLRHCNLAHYPWSLPLKTSKKDYKRIPVFS